MVHTADAAGRYEGLWIAVCDQFKPNGLTCCSKKEIKRL